MTRTTKLRDRMPQGSPTWAWVVVALAWSACGLRSGLVAPGAEEEVEDDAGWGGSASGGSGGQANGGTRASGGTVGSGGLTGKGGSATGGSSGSGGTTARGGSGGSGGTARGGSGGTTARGGSSGSGGTTARGGSGGSGGTTARGGSGGSGGRGGAGGAMTPDAARPEVREAPPVEVGTPVIDPNSGYTTIATGPITMSGYVTATAQGSGSMIGLDYYPNSFCAHGTVGASSTYNSWAVASFNVNEAKDSTGPKQGPLVLTGSEITVTYTNKGGSEVELQLWDNKAGQFWCYFLPTTTGDTTITVPLSAMNTRCWDGSGTGFVSGTAITAIQLSVPGDATTATPFEYCLLGLTVK